MSLFGRRPDPDLIATQLVDGLESSEMTINNTEGEMVRVFHGNDEQTHNDFRAWRKANPDGFHMTESRKGEFVIHWTQDRREGSSGRGCMHQGVSDNDYGMDKGGCYTTARKVCAVSLEELRMWAKDQGYTTRTCSHCDPKQFPLT